MTEGAPADRPPDSRDAADGLACGEIRPGLILNGIYRVERSVARGGMGQVFEGTNVETDERVAIKVVHRHLASDSRVQAMFRKEARILTQLSHPAIAHYRVLARDPAIDVTYIVTDFIDGRPLLDMLNGQSAVVADVQALGKRLAEGLEVAHNAGAIHRDISPDNIMIGEGGIAEARIIDFGIARDLAVGAETVIGDGFAGKLGYVAPEQFGDFERSIGPWTDVYSLALVLIAFARGKAPDMGSSLVEAVERRRAKPDLTQVPDVLRPLFARMLAPDPRERIRTMSEVRMALAQLTVPPSRAIGDKVASPVRGGARLRAIWRTLVRKSAVARTRPMPVPTAELTVFSPLDISQSYPAPVRTPGAAVVKARGGDAASPGNTNNIFRKFGSGRKHHPGLLVVAALIAGSGSLLWIKHERRDVASIASAPSETAPATVAEFSPVAEVSPPELGCAWLDLRPRAVAREALIVRGAAGNPSEVTEAVMRSLRTMGTGAMTVDSTGVLRLTERQCPTLDALRKFRTMASRDLVTLRSEQASFELSVGATGCPVGAYARPVVAVAPTEPSHEFALLALLPSGGVRLISANRAELKALGQRYPDRFGDIGNGGTRITLCEKAKGVMGIAMVEAQQQPALGLVQGREVEPTPDWTAALIKTGRLQGWSVRMVWFSLTDLQADPTQAKPPVRDAASRPAASARPLTRVASIAPAIEPEEKKTAAAAGHDLDYAACRRYDGRWRELGYASLSICVARIFNQRCSVQAGQSGDVALRRYDGRIEAMGGRYERWTRVGRDDCARKDTGTSDSSGPSDKIH